MPTDYQGPGKDKGKKETPPKEKIEPVVTSEVVQKKKGVGRRMKDIFFGGDFKSAARYVAADVLLPALRDMVVNTGTKAIERVVYGEARSQRRNPELRSYVQYNNPFSRGPAQYSHLPDQVRHYPGGFRPSSRDSTQLVIVNRAEAEMVVERMGDILDKYGVVSVADMRELAGLPTTPMDYKFGWESLSGTEVRQVREGYLIDVPQPEPLS